MNNSRIDQLLTMRMRAVYEAPQVQDVILMQNLNLMFEASTELPDGAEEGDPGTFSGITYA